MQFLKSIKSRKRPRLYLPPIRKNGTPPGSWAQSDAEKVELFARHLAEVLSPHDNALDQEIENNLAANSTDSEKLNAFTTNDLINVLNKLHPLKAPGHDRITALMIQKLPPKGIQTLMHIYNSIIRSNYWPVTLKQAKVIMVPKPGKDPNDVSSYRPISLLPVLSKILEKLILIKLTNEPNSMNWIPWHKFGFRKSHSTIQQCHRLEDTINKALEDKNYCPAVFLDVSQAFDKVWHRGLMLKILQTLPTKYFRILRSHLQCRYLTITCNHGTFSPIPKLSGVPQGSILGPILYTVYTADIPQSPLTTLSTYADDTAIFSTHHNPDTATSFTFTFTFILSLSGH